MSSFGHDLVAVDRGRLDLKAGVAGLVVVAVLGAVVAVVGPEALAAVIGALVVLTTEPPATGRSWAATLLPVLVAGTVLTYISVSLGGQAAAAALLVGLAAIVSGVHAGRSPGAETRSLVASIWIVVALTLQDSGVSALAYSVAFAAGGVLGAVVALLKSRRETGQPPGDDEAAPAAGFTDRPVIVFAVLRGLGLAAAVFVGFTWFPEHAAWVAVTALLVMRPPTDQAVAVGLQRSLGTGVGVTIAVVAADVVGENKPALLVLFLASAFLMMAVREVNHALFAAFVTTLVVYLQRLLGADASESGTARLVETVIGVLIAFVVLGMTRALSREEADA